MAINKNTRQEIYNRDGNKCLKCGSPEELTIDHIVPLSKYGSNERFNLQTLCKPCNEDKADTEVDYREWPEFEPEQKFDWSLSFRQLEERYLHKKKPAKKIAKKHNSSDNKLWDGKMPQVNRTEKEFLLYQDRKCFLYGKMNCDIGYGCNTGKDVYYDEREEKFIMEYFGTVIAYHYKSISKLVDKNETPKAIVKSIQTTTSKFDIAKYLAEPEPNFHYSN
jgi:hypothetical protein